jgi:chromosome segregation ATPase
MARIGLLKSDVEKARDSLRAQSQYPSVDAVRIALGNTGSKSTIHKYLKELDDEQGGDVGKANESTLSDALHDLVARLAARLQAEADDKLDTAQAALRAREQQTLEAQRQLESELRTAREQGTRLQAELRQQRLAFNVKQDEFAQLSKENSRLATELAHTKQSLYEQLTHARKLEDKVEQMQAQQRHTGDLERQLATSIAHHERLGEQLGAAEAALAPALARTRELELQLVQAHANAQAQQQVGEQLRAYLAQIGPRPSPL